MPRGGVTQNRDKLATHNLGSTGLDYALGESGRQVGFPAPTGLEIHLRPGFSGFPYTLTTGQGDWRMMA